MHRYLKRVLKNIVDVTVFLGLVIGTFYFGKNLYQADIPQEMILNSVQSTVAYTVKYSENNKDLIGTCSGVVLENTENLAIVITASHCIKSDGQIFIDSIPAVKVAKHGTRDLALVLLNQGIPLKKPATFPVKPQLLFDKLYYVGMPSNQLFFSRGFTISQSYSEDIGIFSLIQGCSGGGVYNKKGELIGIGVAYKSIFGIYEHVRGLSDYIARVNIEKIKEALRKE